MGFLDGLVSDMVGNVAGVNPRRLVRMVGGKNILMMGAGAALGGGLAAALSKGQGGAAGQGPSTFTGSQPVPPSQAPGTGYPPPPPPGPAQTIPPPPPGPAQTIPPPPPGPAQTIPPPPAPEAPAPETAADEPSPEMTYAIVRTMVAAALADGNLAPEEKAIIQKHLGTSGLGGEQIRQIHQDLVLPPSPAELAALVPGGASREALYRFGGLIVLADRQTSDLERGWLNRLAAALELPAERVAVLEREIFSE